MSTSSKLMADNDAEQIVRYVFDNETRTIATSTFIQGKVGHKISVSFPSVSSEDYTYMDGSNILQVIRITYSDSTKATLLTVERIA